VLDDRLAQVDHGVACEHTKDREQVRKV